MKRNRIVTLCRPRSDANMGKNKNTDYYRTLEYCYANAMYRNRRRKYSLSRPSLKTRLITLSHPADFILRRRGQSNIIFKVNLRYSLIKAGESYSFVRGLNNER